MVSRVRSWLLPSIGVVCFFMVCGCESLPKPPYLPPGINAELPTYEGTRPLPWSVSADSDASVLAYVQATGEYDITTNREITHWHLCEMRKVSTAQGRFDSDTLHFVYYTSSNIPGSRWQARFLPTPFRRGVVLLLGLKTDKKPCEIVSMEQRSWLAPYGPYVKPTGEIPDGEFDPVIRSVLSFLRRDGYAVRRMRSGPLNSASAGDGSVRILEETETHYVVEAAFPREETLLMVNKATLETKRLPSP